MNKNLTELVFILDKSGSMSGLEDDTIGGFNAMLKQHQAQEGAARITTVLFDNRYELLHDRLDLMAVSPMTAKEYGVGGSTALLDAMGRAIQKMDAVQKNSAEDYRAARVMFVIITDGMENASRKFTKGEIEELVKERRSQGWEFIFLGANMDAVQVAQDYGIAPDRSVTFQLDQVGVNLNYQAVADATLQYRKNRAISPDWDKKIRERKDK